MVKTQEELNALKEEVETVNKKPHELTEEELEHVTGGTDWAKFGQCVLKNGGGGIPALAELVSAINNQNWPLVAILFTKVSDLPIVVKSWNEAQ